MRSRTGELSHGRGLGAGSGHRIRAWLIVGLLPLLLAHEARADDVPEGGAIIILPGRPSALPALDLVPPARALQSAEVDDELLALVSQLDAGDFDVRERAMQTLLERPGEDLPYFALLARGGEHALSIEQRQRLLAVLRERVVGAPGGALGIALQALPVPGAQRFDIEVTGLLPGLPAAELLRVGDRIVALDGEPFEVPSALTERVQVRRPGDAVMLSVVRPRPRDPHHLNQVRVVAEQLEIRVTLGSSHRAGDTSEDRPPLAPTVLEHRQRSWAEVERRFRREPVVLELAGELPWIVPSPRRARSEPGERAGNQERPELTQALLDAIVATDEELALQLVEQGAPVNAKNDRDVSVLHYAARATMPKLTRRLLELGAQIDATIERGFQPIHWAARAGASDREGAAETINVLLEFGADINARSDNGTLPITYAVMLGNDKWRDFLASRGAVVE